MSADTRSRRAHRGRHRGRLPRGIGRTTSAGWPATAGRSPSSTSTARPPSARPPRSAATGRWLARRRRRRRRPGLGRGGHRPVEASLPPVIGLANVAGVSSVDFLDVTLAEWDRIFDINMQGAFLVTRRVVPAMLAAGVGRIVSVSSASAQRGGGTYSVPTAPPRRRSSASAGRWPASWVNAGSVNCVAPGPIDTDIMGGTLTEERKAALGADGMVGRVGTVAEVAALLAFLLGEEPASSPPRPTTSTAASRSPDVGDGTSGSDGEPASGAGGAGRPGTSPPGPGRRRPADRGPGRRPHGIPDGPRRRRGPAMFEPDALAAGLSEAGATCFVLTNTRSLPEADAVELNARIGRMLFELADRLEAPIGVVSRGGSTLRGVIAEVRALDAARRQATAAASTACWRRTSRPAGSPSGTCTGRGSAPTSGRSARPSSPATPPSAMRPPTCASSSPRRAVARSRRTRWPASPRTTSAWAGRQVAEVLVGVTGGGFVVVNAVEYADLEVVVLGLLDAEAAGRSFLCRTGPSFVQPLAGLDPRGR